MGECNIILKINGKDHIFHSDEELDGWLYDHRDSLSFSEKDATFSIKSPQEVALEKIHKAVSLGAKFNTNANSRIATKELNNEAPVYTTPTRFTKFGGKPQTVGGRTLWTTPVFSAKRIETKGPFNERLSDMKMALGHDFDSMMEFALDKSSTINTTIVKHGSKQYNSMLQAAMQVAKQIKKDHPNARFLMQSTIAAKEITMAFQRSLQLAMSTAPNDRVFGGLAEDINSFLGEPDLLVIDEDGSVSVYDFKTSGGEVTVDNHPEYKIQIACYAQMLKQWGLKIKNVKLIPVKVNYIDSNADLGEKNIAEINGFEVKPFSELHNGDEVWNTVEKWMNTVMETTSGELTELTDVLKEVAPNTSVTKQAEFKQLEVEAEFQRRYKTPENNPEFGRGNIWAYEKTGSRPDEDHYLYARTEEDLKKQIEKWVETANNRAADTYKNFAEDLKKAMRDGSLQSLVDIAKIYNGYDVKYITRMFRRYLKGWHLISSDDMIANGLFLFQNRELIEMVVLDTYNPLSKIKWEHGNTVRKYTTVLGHFKADDEYVDKRWILPNFNGNLAMLKGMIYLSQHPELFKNASLNRVATMSLNKPAMLEESLEKLNENYKQIALEYQKVTGKTLNVFTIGKEINSDATAYVNIAMELLRDVSDDDIQRMLKFDSAFKDVEDNAQHALHEIQSMIRRLKYDSTRSLKDSERTTTLVQNDPVAEALLYLNRAYLSKIGYQISPEERVGTFMSNGLNLNGLRATSFADSPSAIARTLHEAVYSFTRICQNEYVRYTAKWKKLIQQFYKEKGYDENVGGEWNAFEDFFQQENGKISSKFMLKRVGEMSTDTENEILKMMYDALDRFQYGKGRVSEDKFIQAKQDAINAGKYGEMPLIKSGLVEKSGRMGTIKAIMEKAKTDWNIMRDFLLGVDISEALVRDLNDIDSQRIPALVFENQDREMKLNASENAVDNYTTDLEFIFNMIAAQGIKEEMSPQILMTASAIRAVLADMAYYGVNAKNGTDLTETANAIRDYIKDKLFNRPIMNEGELKASRIINMVKGITSFITLGANFRALTRETITGIERGFVRFKISPEFNGNDDERLTLIKVSDYKDALNELMANAYKNTDVMSFHMQLNQLFGTANFSYNQMAEASKIMQVAVKDFQLSDLYFTSTWPDFIHRNAIVIAYLKGVGAYKAYTLVDGILQYDMQKDDRFNLINKWRKREDVPLSEIKRWDKQNETYQDELDSWIKNGYKKPDGSSLKYGDDLPQALSPRDVLGLKDMADRLYGNYDSETKSLMTKQLLGSMFFQFRTYGLMRLREIFNTGGSTSDIRMIVDKIRNKNGELEDAYMVENDNTDAVERGQEFVMKIVPESEVSLEDIRNKKASRSRRPYGYYSPPGQVNTLLDLGASLFLHKNQKEFEQLWNNCPGYRANVMIFMIDTLGMLLLSILIQQLFGEAMSGDYNEVDWFTKWSYNVAIGVTQDGPVWQVVSSVIGDGAPPMLGVLQSFGDNAWGVITGKRNLLYGLANTFGASRELAYLFK